MIQTCLDAFAADDNAIGKVPLVERWQRQYSTEHRKAIDDEIGKYRQIGVMRPPTSPRASPIVIVKKSAVAEHTWTNRWA